METGPWCNICQCILYEAERILFLCFSTFQCHTGLFTENRTGPSDWCTPSSNLVDPTLVLLHLWVDYTVLLPRSHHLLIQPHNHALHPLREQMKLTARKLSGKAYCREMFQTRLHKSSSSPGPQGHRSSASLASHNGLFFLSKWKSDPYDPPLTAVLYFLASLHDKRLSYTTINTARSAISAITVLVNNMTIGTHPLISRFMKGVYKGSPPTSRYQWPWDVQPVLTCISFLKPHEKLDLKTLALKLVMSMSLVTVQRGQSLHIVDNDYMKEVPDGFNLQVSLVFNLNRNSLSTTRR